MYWKIGVNIAAALVVGLVQTGLPVQAQVSVEEVTPTTETGAENLVGQVSPVAGQSFVFSGEVGNPVSLSFEEFVSVLNPQEENPIPQEVTLTSVPIAGQLEVAGNPVGVGTVLTPEQVLVYRPDTPGSYEFRWRADVGLEGVVVLDIAPAPIVEEVPSVPDVSVVTRAEKDRGFEFGELGLDSLVGIRIVRSPENGQLLYDGQSALPRVINNEDIERLVYRPNPEYTGADSFGYVGVRGDEMESVNVGVVSINIEPKQVTSPTTPDPAPSNPTPQPEPQTPPVDNSTPQTPQPEPVTPPQREVFGKTPGKNIKPMLTKVRVANPLNYALENVQVRLATDSKKTPFSVGSYRLKGSGVVVQEVDTPGELKLTLARIEPGEEVEISNLVETPEDEEVDVEKTVQVDAVDASGAVVELANLTPATSFEGGLEGLEGIENTPDEEVSWKLQWLVGITLLILGAGVVLSLWHKKFVGARERRQLLG